MIDISHILIRYSHIYLWNCYPFCKGPYKLVSHLDFLSYNFLFKQMFLTALAFSGSDKLFSQVCLCANGVDLPCLCLSFMPSSCCLWRISVRQ